MLDAIHTLATALGYLALLVAVGWLIDRSINRKSEALSPPPSSDATPRKPLWELMRSLEAKEPSISSMSWPSKDRRYEIQLEKRLDHIDCFVESATTRVSGEGSGEFIHLVFSRDEINSIAEWAKMSPEDHWESMRKMREEYDMSDEE